MIWYDILFLEETWLLFSHASIYYNYKIQTASGNDHRNLAY